MKPKSSSETEETTDDYEDRIRRTGCYDENENLQLCFYRTKDWRQCQKELEIFRACYKEYQKTKHENNAS